MSFNVLVLVNLIPVGRSFFRSSDFSFSPHATAAFNDLHPLTPAQLATFTCLEVKALLSSDPVFVVSKKFSTLDDFEPDPELCRNFLLEDPWIAVRGIYSDFVVCSGCRSIIAGEEDYQRDIGAWILHRDSCAGIEDKILNAIVQSWDALDAMSLMWETVRQVCAHTSSTFLNGKSTTGEVIVLTD